MKIATIDLTPDLFVEFTKVCQDGPPRYFVVKENPLPEDARIVRVGLRPNCGHRIWRLFIESESFAEVADDETPPELPPIVFQTVYAECSELPQ